MARERSTWCLLYVEAADEHEALAEVRSFLGLEDDGDGNFRLPVADLEVRHAMEWPGRSSTSSSCRTRRTTLSWR